MVWNISVLFTAKPVSTACCWAVAFCVADSVFQEMHWSTLAAKDVGTFSARA